MSPIIDDTRSWAVRAASETPVQEDSYQTLLWEVERISGVRKLHDDSEVRKDLEISKTRTFTKVPS